MISRTSGTPILIGSESMGNELFIVVVGITLWCFLGAGYAMRSRGKFAWFKLFMAGPFVWVLFFVLLALNVKGAKKDE